MAQNYRGLVLTEWKVWARARKYEANTPTRMSAAITYTTRKTTRTFRRAVGGSFLSRPQSRQGNPSQRKNDRLLLVFIFFSHLLELRTLPARSTRGTLVPPEIPHGGGLAVVGLRSLVRISCSRGRRSNLHG